MDDLIRRQAAIDTLNVDAELLRRVLDNTDLVGAEREKFEWGLGLIESHIYDMKELPSAQPERKKGKWVEVAVTDGYDKDGIKTWISVMQCDQCGFIVNAVEGHMAQYNYCPNCGAQMEK